MADPVDLELIEGEPYNREFRVIDGALIWPTRQVWAQVRSGPGAALLADLTPHLAISVDPIDGDDLLITLNLTGADTRRVRNGARWDLYIAEPGSAQLDARRILQGAVVVDRAITSGPLP